MSQHAGRCSAVLTKCWELLQLRVLGVSASSSPESCLPESEVAVVPARQVSSATGWGLFLEIQHRGFLPAIHQVCNFHLLLKNPSLVPISYINPSVYESCIPVLLNTGRPCFLTAVLTPLTDVYNTCST